jgi:hypothetical protein
MKTMKNIPFIAMLICLGALAFCQARAQDAGKITTSINFINVSVDKVLDTYKASAKAELIVASNVRYVHGITLLATAVTPEEAQHLIEQALLKQGGIVITRLDEKRVSVTYNDQLKLQP